MAQHKCNGPEFHGLIFFSTIGKFIEGCYEFYYVIILFIKKWVRDNREEIRLGK